MFRWLYLAIDRFGRPSPRRLAWRLDYVPCSVIREITEAKLVRLLGHVFRNSPAQRKYWEDAGIKRSDLRSPDVLKDIPLCDSQNLALRPEDYFCVPEEELIHVISTAGTSGQRKTLFFTTDDCDRQAMMIGTNLRRLPGASRVMTLFLELDPTWSAGAFARRGIEKAEMFGLMSGTHLRTHEQIALIKEYRINVLMSSPTYIHRLTLEAEQDLRSLGVRYLILATEPWSEGLRRELEEAWGAKAIDAYGCNECGTGVASECIHQNGLHVPAADFWVEILDPATGTRVQDGEVGEIVVTTLSRRGMPLVRYRIGDLACYLPDEGRCRCGLPLRKLSRIKGRRDDMFFLGAGRSVFPDELHQAVLSVPGVSDYQLVLEKEGYKDVVSLTVETDDDGSELREKVVRALMSVKAVGHSYKHDDTLEIRDIISAPRGSLSDGRPKSIRIVDRRTSD